MKFPRSKVLIVLLLLDLIIVYANLLLSDVKQERSQSSLRDQIDASVKTLGLLPTPPAYQQERLVKVRKAYDSALTDVSRTDIDSTQIIEILIQTAGKNNLNVNPIITDQWTERTFGLTAYRVLPFTLEVKGNIQEIIDYIQQLEDRTIFPYLAIEGLTMVEPSPNTATTGNDEQQATINAKIVVRQTPRN